MRNLIPPKHSKYSPSGKHRYANNLLTKILKLNRILTISLCLSNFFLLGVNFIKVLQAAFTRVDSKSTKKTSSHQCLFALMGPTHVKAACKMLVKLTPGLISFLIFFICTSECCVSVKCVTSNSTHQHLSIHHTSSLQLHKARVYCLGPEICFHKLRFSDIANFEKP